MKKAIKQKSKRYLALLVMLCMVFYFAPVSAYAESRTTASVTMSFASLTGFGSIESATMYYNDDVNVKFSFDISKGEGSGANYKSVQATVTNETTVSAKLPDVYNGWNESETMYALIVVAKNTKGVYAIYGYTPTIGEDGNFSCGGGAQQLYLNVIDNSYLQGGGTFYFASPKITTSVTPTDSGSVDGGGYYAYNTSATLTATANPGYVFKQWSDNSSTSVTRTVTVTGNATYTAEFQKLPSIIVSGTGVTTTSPTYGNVSGTTTIKTTTSGDYYFPDKPTAKVTSGSATVSVSNTATEVTLSITGLLYGNDVTVTVTGAQQYLGKIGSTYYTSADDLITAMKNATAGTQIVLGSTFNTTAPIQMTPGVLIKRYDASNYTTTAAYTLYSVTGGAVTSVAAEAKIGDTLYATLEEALTAAADNKDTVNIVPTAANDSVFDTTSYTIPEGVTLSYTTKDEVARSVTAVGGSATVNLSGQKTTLTAGSLTCTGEVNVNDKSGTTHSVSSEQEIKVTAGASEDEGVVSNVDKGQSVKIDSVTYTSAANDTSFPLVGKELTTGEKAEIDANSEGAVTLSGGTEITATTANTGATTVEPKEEDGAAYTEVTLGKSGDTIKIGTTETDKKSYTANEDGTVLVIGAKNAVTLKSGEVSLADDDSIGLTLNDDKVLNISNPAEDTPADDKVIVAGGDGTYAGYVTVKDGGSAQIGDNTYSAPEHTEVVYAIGLDGTVKEFSRVATLKDGDSTKIFDDNSVYIENVNNNSDNDEIVVNIEEETATITVPGGTAHQVAVGASVDSKVNYTNGSDDEMVLVVTKGETVPTLTGGSVTVPESKAVKVGDTTYTAPDDANMTISVNEDGKAVLKSGSVQLDDEEAITGVSGREIENTSGDDIDPVVVKSAEDGKKDEIIIPVGGSVTINGVKYENKGETSATLVVGGDTVLVQAGTVCVTPADENTPAAVAVGGDSTVVSGTEPFTVTAGEGNQPGTAVAKPGQTLTISGVEYTTNPAGKEDTIYNLGNPSEAMQKGDTAVFPNAPDTGEGTVTVPTVTLGNNTFAVPAPTYSGSTLTSGNSGDVSVVKTSEDGAATVTIEKAGDKAIIGEETYTATADNTILDVDKDGDVTLAGGGVELDTGKSINVNKKKIAFKDGTAPATVTMNEDGSATVVIPEGTKLTVDGETDPLDGESVYKIDQDGNIKLISKTTYLDDGKDTEANGVTVANPASSNNDRISVKQVEGGPATVTVPEGKGNAVVLTDKAGTEMSYSNASDTEALVLEIADDGSITLTDGTAQLDQNESIVAAPEGGTATLVTNESNDSSSVVTVEIDNENGATIVTSDGAGAVTIGEGDDAKTFTTESSMELTIDKDGNVTLTGGAVKLGSGESVTVDGVTYIAPEDGSLTVAVDSSTGEVTVTGTPAGIVIDPEKFKDPDFVFNMISGVPVTVGDYVYETENENVTLSGVENGNGNPKVTLPVEGNVMDVSLAKDTSKTTAYTAAGADTQFAMSNTGSSVSTEKSDLLGTNEDSGLTFTGTTPVTVNGVTYKGGSADSTYKVMYGTDGKNKVVLPDNGTKVTATFTASEQSLVTEANQVNGKNINEDGAAEDMPFTSVSAPSSIVITKNADGDVNVTGGSQTNLSPVKNDDGDITGYEVKKISSGGSSSGVNVTKTEHGTVTVDKPYASSGQTVTITVEPDEGYELGSLTVTDSKGNPVELKDLGNGKYTFTMPDGKVTVSASFQVCPSEKFTDVDTTQYYHEAVDWAVLSDVTTGTTPTTFSPNASCTRAQMVTFLWRAVGSPTPTSTTTPFTDVDSGAYYYDAVLWATEQGITVGTSVTTFSPNEAVTRGQTVTFLYRYAGSPAVSGGNNFTDVSADAYYAKAVQWAVTNGVTYGTSTTTFSPENDCTRAQIVTLLYRYIAG